MKIAMMSVPHLCRLGLMIGSLLCLPFAQAAVVVNDPFTDGSRTNFFGGDTQGLVYYYAASGAGTLTVSNDAGIGSGNALYLAPASDAGKLVGQFNPVTLVNPGDYIQVSFDFRYETAPSNTATALRLGLYNTAMTRTTADGSSSARNDDAGYGFLTNPGLDGTSTSVYSEAATNDVLGGSAPGYTTSIGAAGASLNLGTTKHTVNLLFTRQASGDLSLSAWFDSATPATATVAATNVLTYRFDSFAIGEAVAGVRNPFYLDNLSITATIDDFDRLRFKWFDIITGGTNLDLSDPYVLNGIQSITNNAVSYWTKMDKTFTNTYLWSDLARTTDSGQISSCYSRLRSMAMAYVTYGSSLRSNASLVIDIANGLDWVYTNRYNETKTEYDNWYDWEIGCPKALADCCILLYDNLTPDQLAKYARASKKFTPGPSMTGANLMDTIQGTAVRAVFMKDLTNLLGARDGFSGLFPYVNTGDGYYKDGSFVQHTAHPYTGGYGAVLIDDIAPALPWLKGSPWEVVDPKQTNVINWIYDSYEPLLYGGVFMDLVRGRGVSRGGSGDHGTGHSIMENIVQISAFASPADSLRMKSLVKGVAQADTAHNFPDIVSLPMIAPVRAMLADTNIPARSALVRHKQFPNMDRVVHFRSAWALGLSMCSTRIYDYESINGENLHGWFTGYGMTYLYNPADPLQFTDNFWCTVNPYRMPGVTADDAARADLYGQSKTSSSNWVGGAVLDDLYGAVGMEMNVYGSTLTARKSWFMLDDEVVALGAGITCTDNRGISTTVENRRLTSTGNNIFQINGAALPTTLGWSNTQANVSWCSLDGVGAWYFPTPATLNAVREARSGSLFQINTNYSTNLLTRNYLTTWIDHGKKPTNATYAYVLLPTFSETQASNYAAAPRIQIVENSTQAQAVRHTNLNLLAVNFWTAATKTVDYITCNQKASVVARETPGGLSLGISDPTQTNTGSVTVTFNRSALAFVSADSGVTVSSISPTIQLSVNMSGRDGATAHALFAYTTNTPPVIAISSPADQATLAGTSVPITVDASDPDAGGSVTNVELFADGTKIASLTKAPFAYTWTASALGWHTLTARGTDNTGLMTTSAPVSVLLVPSSSSTWYWDTSTTTGLQTGSGNWNTTDANWSTSSAGDNPLSPWPDYGNAVIFAGSGGNSTVTVLGTQSVDTITFNTAGYTVAGGALRQAYAQNPLLLTANADAAINSPIIGITNFVKDGVGKLALGAPVTYQGDSAILNGTLQLNATNALPATAGLTLGTESTGGKLVLSNADLTVAGLSVSTTNAALTNFISLSRGNTLTVAGPMIVGNVNSNVITRFIVSGTNAALSLDQPNGLMLLGVGATATKGNVVTMDCSGLSFFKAALGPGGLVQVGETNGNTGNGLCAWFMAATNLINAGTFVVGPGGRSANHILKLGSGVNTINADTVNLGIGGRDGSIVTFQTPSGTLTVRGYAGGTNRADLIMGVNATTSTGNSGSNFCDFTGHYVDLLLDKMAISDQRRNGSLTCTFLMNTGLLDANSIVMAQSLGTNGNNNNSFLHLGGGTVNVGPGGIILASNAAGTLNITGSVVTVAGDIIKSPGGTGTATLILSNSSAVLDMTGNAIGDNVTPINNLAFSAGTLRNIGEINGGADLIKTSTNLLALAGTNTYTGCTLVSNGTLWLSGLFSNQNQIIVTNRATLVLSNAQLTLSRLRVCTNSTLLGGATIQGAVLNEGTIFGGGGPTNGLTITGAFTNYGTVRLTNNTPFVVTGTLVNYGLLDLLTGTAILPTNVLNYGRLLTSNNLAISNALISGTNVLIQLPAYSAHNYQLLRADRLTDNSWTNTGAAQPGADASLTLPDSGGAKKPHRFYRVKVQP